MKVILLFGTLCLIWLIPIALSQAIGSCSSINGCVGEDQSCYGLESCLSSFNSTVNPSACYQQCRKDFTCVFIGANATGSCKRTMQGKQCYADGDCNQINLDPKMYCSFGICTLSTSVGVPGDTCTQNSQCLGGKICSNGLCTGVGIGGICTSSSQCTPALYCDLTANPKVCKSRSDANACAGTSECASNDYVCNVGACIPLFSVADQNMCDSNSACGMGEECVNSICLGSVPQNFDNVICAAENQCPNAWTCNCNYNNGVNFCTMGGNSCVSNYVSYRQCTRLNGCHFQSDPTLSTSCSYKYCRTNWLDYQRCLNNNQFARYPSFCTSSASSLFSFFDSF